MGERGGQRLGLALQFGDVDPDGDQSAIGRGRVLDAHPMAIRQFDLEGQALAPLALALGHPGVVEPVCAHHVVEQQTRLQQRRVVRTQSFVRGVPDHQPVVGVIHRQGGGHGVGGRAQPGERAAPVQGLDPAHHRRPKHDERGDGEHHAGQDRA